MRKHGHDARLLQLMDALGNPHPRTEIAQLDQQILCCSDGELLRVFLGRPDVLVRQMEVATQGQLDSSLVLQFVKRVLMAQTIVRKFVVGVRRRDHMRDAIVSGDGAHLLRHLPGTRAIVSVRQNVCVNINHGSIVTTAYDAAPSGITLAIAAASDNGNTWAWLPMPT